MINLLQRGARASKNRETAQHSRQRTHQIQGRHHVTRHRLGTDVMKIGQVEKDRPHQHEEQQVAPIVRQDEPHLGTEGVLPITLRATMNVLGIKHRASFAMEFQLFRPFRQFAEMLVELILLIARLIQPSETGTDQQPVSDRAEDNEDRHHDENHPGKPREIESHRRKVSRRSPRTPV